MSKITILFLLGAVLIAGCSSGQLALSSSDIKVQYKWPAVKIDRYEPVIYPAGPVD